MCAFSLSDSGRTWDAKELLTVDPLETGPIARQLEASCALVASTRTVNQRGKVHGPCPITDLGDAGVGPQDRPAGHRSSTAQRSCTYTAFYGDALARTPGIHP